MQLFRYKPHHVKAFQFQMHLPIPEGIRQYQGLYEDEFCPECNQEYGVHWEIPYPHQIEDDWDDPISVVGKPVCPEDWLLLHFEDCGPTSSIVRRWTSYHPREFDSLFEPAEELVAET